MMWALLCTFLLLCTQQLYTVSFPVNLVPNDNKCADAKCPELNSTNTTKKEGEFPLNLVPNDNKCADAKCPELNCTNATKKEGECCGSCIKIGEVY